MFGKVPGTALKEPSWINEPGSETRVKLASTEKPIPDVSVILLNRSVPVRLKSPWELGAFERHLSGSGDKRRELQGAVVPKGRDHGEGVG